MARESPPTRRVTQLIDALVAEPGRAFSLAELSTQTGITKATALGIVNELCDAGYLHRDPAAKTYRLGTALLAAGASAEASFASLAAARGPMERLSHSLGEAVTASAVVDGQITVLARADAAGTGVAPGIRVGLRYPFAPPSGVMFVAWSPDAVVEQWVRTPPLFGRAPRPEELWFVIRSLRKRGFLLEGLTDFGGALYSLVAGLDDDRVRARLGQLLRDTADPATQSYVYGDVVPGRTYDVSLVCAPVYDRSGALEFLVSVLLMRSGVEATELQEVVDGVLATTAEITGSLGGADPWVEERARKPRRRRTD